jgi:hypothetical protein
MKQFVYPYIVSGLKVAATKKTSLPYKTSSSPGNSRTLNLIKVYSYGPTPSYNY